MFSIQQLFSKGDRFQELLEAAAQESHQSVRLVIDLMKSPRNTQCFDDLILARRKEKEDSPPHISNELVKTFITGLEPRRHRGAGPWDLPDSQGRREIWPNAW